MTTAIPTRPEIHEHNARASQQLESLSRRRSASRPFDRAGKRPKDHLTQDDYDAQREAIESGRLQHDGPGERDALLELASRADATETQFLADTARQTELQRIQRGNALTPDLLAELEHLTGTFSDRQQNLVRARAARGRLVGDDTLSPGELCARLRSLAQIPAALQAVRSHTFNSSRSSREKLENTVVRDVDALQAQLVSQQAALRSALETKPWSELESLWQSIKAGDRPTKGCNR
ncbi:MAG: hypothetical protein ABIG44_14275 [Planctomycetota bacterium]